MMYLENVEGDFKISEEHTDGKYASLDEIRTLDLSSSFKKVLDKKDWMI